MKRINCVRKGNSNEEGSIKNMKGRKQRQGASLGNCERVKWY